MGRSLGVPKPTSRAQKAAKAVQGRVQKWRRARQISVEAALTSRSRCCLTQNSPAKVCFLPPEAGTDFRSQNIQKHTSRAQTAAKAVQGRFQKCCPARQISVGAALTSRSRCCLTQNSRTKVRFLPPRVGTDFRPPNAIIKSPKASKSSPMKGPKMPPCQADFRRRRR